jgi:uncharacterized protein (DUF2147 family)
MLYHKPAYVWSRTSEIRQTARSRPPNNTSTPRIRLMFVMKFLKLSRSLPRGWALLVPLLWAACASAQGFGTGAPISVLSSPVGRWKTVDDHTGQVKSIVRIREQNGTLYGTVEQIFNPPVPNPLCIACTGALKNRPIIGLQILWGLRKGGNEWSGGEILDPETGHIYRCFLTLEDGGTKLRVRGYIGLSIFGRTERWLRVN